MRRPSPQKLLQHNVTAHLAAQSISMDQLGERLGWPQTDLDALAAGTLDASLDQLDALAHTLGALPVDLLEDIVPAGRPMELAP